MDPAITKRKALTGIHGERVWYCEPFTTTESVDLLSEILDVGIGGGSRTLDQILDSGLDQNAAATFFSGLGGVPRRLINAGGAGLLKRLLANCEVEDPQIKTKDGRMRLSLATEHVFEQQGQGNLGEILKAAAWAIEVNWRPLWLEFIASLTAFSGAGGARSQPTAPLTTSSPSAAA